MTEKCIYPFFRFSIATDPGVDMGGNFFGFTVLAVVKERSALAKISEPVSKSSAAAGTFVFGVMVLCLYLFVVDVMTCAVVCWLHEPPVEGLSVQFLSFPC